MITLDKLRIYEKFGGDYDGFARASRSGQLGSMSNQDWQLIDELLRCLWMVQSGLASDAFEAQTRAKALEAAEDEQVLERFFQLSKPKT